MFHLFQTYITSVSFGSYKSRSGCCIYKHVVSICFKCFRYFIRMLQLCFPGVSDVCCKCFNCFGRILQVFYLDVVKVDLGVAHVVVGPIYSSHLLKLLGLPACAWVWRGRVLWQYGVDDFYQDPIQLQVPPSIATHASPCC